MESELCSPLGMSDYEETGRFAHNKEVQSMSLEEKYAIADFNAVKSHERSVGRAEGRAEERKDNLETVTKNLMKLMNISQEEAEKQARALFSK